MNWERVTDRQYRVGPYLAIAELKGDRFVAQICYADYDITEPISGTGAERRTLESALRVAIKEYDHWARCPELGLT